MEIPENLLNKLSFPDFEVEKMVFDKSKNKIHIHVFGGFLDIDEGIILNKGVLYIFNYTQIIGRLYCNNKWKSLVLNSFEPLKSIEEFIVDKDIMYLRGFGKESGYWVEYKILNPQINASFTN